MFTITKMAAQSSGMATPRKTLSLGNICIICGFSFIHTFIDSNGKEITQKFFDKKFKLTEERKKIINSVCQKCFRTVERLSKMEKEVSELKCKLKYSAENVKENFLLSLPSPKRSVITKRMLRSPIIRQPTKKVASLLPITCVQPISILPFSDLTNRGGLPVAKQVKPPVRRSLGTSFTNRPSETHTTLQGEVTI
ncbi:uncharacterized protein LOC133175140 [Saccostrea echinata]|uniref:uncharacterized protein LOC133175140 n=1 Tax=Saccostrea echinata TaxID=191078 RepID=UPI002A811AE0|nr:uncharacterized protein LOC133175140 [Saccostrea echinata]